MNQTIIANLGRVRNFTKLTLVFIKVFTGYVRLVVKTSRSFPLLWLIIGFVTRLIRRVPLVEQELLSLPDHMSWTPVHSGVRVTRSIVLRVRCLSYCTFSFGHCVVWSSIFVFWLPLWYLQTLLAIIIQGSPMDDK